MSGKNDWVAGDTLTRNKMNQPAWLVSGTIAASPDATGIARVYYGQGIVKWGNKSAPVVYGPGLGSFSFGPVVASREYAMFVRRDGSLMVSGNTAGTGLSTFNAAVTPPRWDAELIGIVQTQASLASPLLGPWNSTTDASNTYEQRGQYNAIVSSRPRAVYVNIPNGQYTPGTINANINSFNLASGIAFLNLDDFSNQMSDSVTMLHASILWVPSGALGYAGVNRLCATPNFILWRGDDYRTTNWAGSALDSRTYEVLQDPDNQAGSTAPGAVQWHTTTMVAINMRGLTTKGYVLGVYLDPSASRTTGVTADLTWTAIRIAGVSFVALPGHKSTLPLGIAGSTEP